MTRISKTALLINTGSSRNLGDRAMLFNICRLLSARGARYIYSTYPSGPPDINGETEVLGYVSLCSRLGRFASLGVKPDSSIVMIELFILFTGLSALCIPTLFSRSWLSAWLNRDDLLSAIDRSDFILFSGGGYLTDMGRLEARACLLTGVLGIMLGKPVYFSGQGIGPVKEPLTRVLLKFVARRAKRILLRDRDASRNLLVNLNVDSKKIRESGDDALTLAAVPPAPDSRKNISKILGVHLRLTPFGNKSAVLIEHARSIFQPLIQEGWKLRFYKFATQSTWETDIYSKITRNMDDDVYSIVHFNEPGEVRQSVGECTVCIGMAYHFLLFSLAEAVPAIGIYSGPYYRQKLQGLYGWYGRQEWVLDQDQAQSEVLIKLIHALDSEHTFLAEQLSEITSELSTHYLREIDEMIQIAMDE